MVKFAVLILSFVFSSVPIVKQSVPFASVSVNGVDLATADGLSWQMVSDSEVVAEASEVGITSILTVDDSTALIVGSLDADVEGLVISTLASMPKNPTTASMTADSHPKQPVAVFHFKKTILTARHEEKVIYKDIEVEKRPGETGAEFSRRADQEQADAIDAGWTSIP